MNARSLQQSNPSPTQQRQQELRKKRNMQGKLKPSTAWGYQLGVLCSQGKAPNVYHKLPPVWKSSRLVRPLCGLIPQLSLYMSKGW